MIAATNGRPAALKAAIMDVMKDNRERTTSDLVVALSPQGFNNPKSIGRTMSDLAANGCMARDTHDKLAIWRARG